MPQSALVAVSLIGTAISAISQIQAGDAAKRQADIQADIQRQQARQAKAKAALEAADFRKKASAAAARTRAAGGASGLQIGTGSSLLASEDFISESRIQEGRIKLGGELQANRLNTQASLTEFSGRSAQRASRFRAGATILSGVGSAFGGGMMGGGGGGNFAPATTVVSGGNQALLPPRRF